MPDSPYSVPAQSAGALLARLVCAICIFVQTACTTATPSTVQPRLALVIGNSAYEVFDPLVNPAHDAADMCAALKRLGFSTRCYTDLRHRGEFVARTQEFADQLGPETVAVFYYAGHAVQVEHENYLIPTQARVGSPKDLAQQFFGMNELFDNLARRQTSFTMVVLDACRKDPYSNTTTQKTRSAIVATSRAITLKALDEAHAVYGLQPIKDAPVGTMVLYATAANDAAFDGEGRNGPLTKHILAHIETPSINVETMIKEVTRGVQDDTTKEFRKRQTPFVHSSFSGNFCFAGCLEHVFVTPTP